MTTEPAAPVHLSKNHRDTLDQILRHPSSHNVEWHDVLALLTEAGEVTERHDGKFAVTLGGEKEIFDRPRNKDVDVQMLVDLRRMLEGAGYGPSKDE